MYCSYSQSDEAVTILATIIFARLRHNAVTLPMEHICLVMDAYGTNALSTCTRATQINV
jgi:hypothetical protein